MSPPSTKQVAPKGSKKGDPQIPLDDVLKEFGITEAVDPHTSAPMDPPQLNLPKSHFENAGDFVLEENSRSRVRTLKVSPTETPKESDRSSLLSPDSAHHSGSQRMSKTTQSEKPGSHTEAVVTKSTDSRYNASSFAKGGGSLKQKGPNYLTDWFLYDRSTTRHSVYELASTPDEFRSPIFSIYEEYTRIVIPEGWLDTIPISSDVNKVDDYRRGAMTALREALHARRRFHSATPSHLSDKLTRDAVANLLKQRCCEIIIDAVARARTLQEASKNGRVPEAQWRRIWDTLIESVFLLANKENVQFLVERTIKMSRNQLALGTNQVINQVSKLCLDYAEFHSGFSDKKRQKSRTSLGHQQLDGAHATTKAAFIEQHTRAAGLFAYAGDLQRGAMNAKARSKYDPANARCDALVVFALNLDGLENVADAERRKFSFFGYGEGEDAPVCPSDYLISTDELSPSSRAAHNGDLSHDLFYLNTPSAGLASEDTSLARTDASSSKAASNIQNKNDKGKQSSATRTVSSERGNVLHLPFFLAEYKRAQTEHDAGSNQTRLYLNAAVSFLAAAGILEQPVFGLTTNGLHGVLSCAYARRERARNANGPTHTMILERNAMLFDLSNPLSCLHFTSCLCYMAVHLVTRLEDKTNEIVASHLINGIIQGEQATQWSMDHSTSA